MSLLSFGENVTIHVVATSTQETEVRIESASRIFLNFINGGANKKNVQSLEDYFRNEVNKLCSDEEIKLKQGQMPVLTVAVSYTAADTPARPSAPHPSCAAHTACSGTL